MRFIADLHIHSKYSRATSKEMNLEDLDHWADDKGILVMGTGDFTYPLWFKEIQEKLEPAEPGLFKLKQQFKKKTLKDTFSQTRFLLSVEISGIYSRAGRTRRVHNIVFAPSIETAEKINTQLGLIGNLKSDGRPILGLDSEKLAEIVFNIDSSAVIIPAHCLLPNTIVHTKDDLLKKIQNIQEGDYVITHNNRWRKVQQIFKRQYNGKIYNIKPRNFSLGLTTTAEHPFYAIKTHKNCHWSKGICKPSHINLEDCKHKYYKNYELQWIMASKLERGDVLIFPRFKNIFENHKEIDLEEITKQSNFVKTETKGEFIVPIGNKITAIKQRIIVDENFCKLAGYYLAEGYTNSRDLIGFAFSDKEKKYIEEVTKLMKEVFGFDKQPKLKTNKTGGIEIIFYSKILCEAFHNLFYSSPKIRNASTKALPIWTLGLPLNLQVEIFRCWWRGDSGYTASRLLMNQMKIILLRLGIVPSIHVTTKENHHRKKHFIGDREIKARYDIYSLNQLSFYEDKFNLLKEPEFSRVAKHNNGGKYGWMDDNYIYLPIYNIEVKNYEGEVYNIEVEEDNSYVCEFATVHNCWTPWFSVFGSMSGFDSIEECFGKYAKNIFAIETGLSSDPIMNWRLSKLDNIALISNSDSHSLERIGREANIFDTELSYGGIMEAIKSGAPNARKNLKTEKLKNSKTNFIATIEFFPEEGKYHYDGHRNCGVVFEPKETKKHKNICPKCGRPLTIGVMNRVDALADRPQPKTKKEKFEELSAITYDNLVPYVNLITLNSIIAEAFGVGPKSKKVKAEYEKLIKNFGSELKVLMKTKISDIATATDSRIAEAIKRMREGKIKISPGYDGEYGVVKIFNDEERETLKNQTSLF